MYAVFIVVKSVRYTLSALRYMPVILQLRGKVFNYETGEQAWIPGQNIYVSYGSVMDVLDLRLFYSDYVIKNMT